MSWFMHEFNLQLLWEELFVCAALSALKSAWAMCTCQTIAVSDKAWCEWVKQEFDAAIFTLEVC